MPTRVGADVGLRRQVRLRHRHRVPRAQGQPTLRHHAVADGPLHDRYAARASRCAAKFVDDDRVVLAVAATNGSATTEQFHFYDEVDSQRRQDHQRPALGEAAAPARSRDRAVGEYGSQDRALDSRDPLWFVGVDLLGHFGAVDIKAQCLSGQVGGRAPDRLYDPNAPPVWPRPEERRLPRARLDDHVAARRAWAAASSATRSSGSAIPTADRGGRPALHHEVLARHRRGAAVINEHVVLKAEYLHNGEYGQVPQIRRTTCSRARWC